MGREESKAELFQWMLSPGFYWRRTTELSDKKKIVESWEDEFLPEIVHFAQNNYELYVQTPYWSVIAEEEKWKADYRCKVCNSPESLHTHHRVYDKLGYEYSDRVDLVVLCKRCHELHHIEKRKKDIKP